MPKIWYVVADGARARILERNRETGAYHAIRDYASALARLKSSELKSDRPGRVFESGSGTRHAAAPRHDPHRDAKLAFAREIAGHIEAAARQHAFDWLVLAAPSRIQGEIGNHLPPATRDRVAFKLAKDLTKVPDGDLGPHLDGIADRIESGRLVGDGTGV